jgi:hypothetical protein
MTEKEELSNTPNKIQAFFDLFNEISMDGRQKGIISQDAVLLPLNSKFTKYNFLWAHECESLTDNPIFTVAIYCNRGPDIMLIVVLKDGFYNLTVLHYDKILCHEIKFESTEAIRELIDKITASIERKDAIELIIESMKNNAVRC